MIFKYYVELCNLVLTPLIAILAVYIALQQYRVNRSSLNNQQYLRKLQVFKAVMSYLADTIREGNTSFQRISQFYAEASEADFLFSNEKILKKINELYDKGVDLVVVSEKLYPSNGSKGLPVGVDISTAANEKGELLKWFNRQIKVSKELFKKEMRAKQPFSLNCLRWVCERLRCD